MLKVHALLEIQWEGAGTIMNMNMQNQLLCVRILYLT